VLTVAAVLPGIRVRRETRAGAGSTGILLAGPLGRPRRRCEHFRGFRVLEVLERGARISASRARDRAGRLLGGAVEAPDDGLRPGEARRNGLKDERNTECRIDNAPWQTSGYDGQWVGLGLNTSAVPLGPQDSGNGQTHPAQPT
jgi:hypothetical protein